MAVAFVSANEGVATSAGTSLTVSGVNGAAGNIVIACVSYRDNSSPLSNISGVTYDGNAMTQLGTEWTTGRSIGIFYLVNPTGSSQDVVVTMTSSTNNIQCSVLVMSGVDTSNPFGTAQTSNGFGTATATPSVTSSADGLCFDVLTLSGDVGVIGADQTLRATPQVSGTYQEVSTKAGAASVTMGWTFTAIDYNHVVVPVSAGSGGVPTITDAGDESFLESESAVTITGANFGATQGSGAVKLSPTDDVDDARAVTQTVNSWSDTSIEIGVVRGSLPVFTNLYLFVTENGGTSNAAGYVVQLETTPIVLTVA